MAPLNDEAAFWRKVDRRGPDDCWPWLGGCNEQGYGVWYMAGRKHAAHRWLLGRLRGKPLIGTTEGIEDGCHRCDNPPCCNPAHLYVGTRKQNIADAVERKRLWQLKRTECPKGHPYSERRRKSGARRCYQCERAADLARRPERYSRR